jgi:translation initiation factor 1 (eIF-1/SUI1)
VAKDKGRIATDAGSGSGLRQGLPGLDGLRAALPAGPAAKDRPTDAGHSGSGGPTAAGATAVTPGGAPSPPAKRTPWNAATKLVVRRERKGHGGKTATRIEGLSGSTRELEEAVREVKRALGCGASRDGRDVVVQGDQGERLLAFLADRGARRVVVGS